MITMQALVTTAFWLCSATVVYTYAVYPALAFFLSRFFGRRLARPKEIADDQLPALSVLIAAHNEEDVIEQRIEDALRIDYPPTKLEIVVASDGSTDATSAIVHRFVNRGVRLLEYAERRGKAAVLNDAIAELRGEIVLLSDANTSIDAAAARKLVSWFDRDDVGVVCGRLILTDPKSGRNVDSMYWKYETLLKRCESRLGALLGANGAIYAIRRQLYESIPVETIVDDFVIPLRAKLRSGCAIVYDDEAIAREETAPSIESEFGRRARIGAGGLQSIVSLRSLLNPRRGWIALAFLSHKVLRWLCPLFLVGLLITNVLLLGQTFYRIALIMQSVFYTVSAVGMFLPGKGMVARLTRLVTMFSVMNVALAVGFWRWWSGQQRGVWQRTAR